MLGCQPAPAPAPAGLPDARAKENVRALDEVVRSVEIASEISVCLYNYKVRRRALHAPARGCAGPPTHVLHACVQGTEAQRLGVLAQQTRAVLERHAAAHLNIVKEDAQASSWRPGQLVGWRAGRGRLHRAGRAAAACRRCRSTPPLPLHAAGLPGR